MNRALLDFGIAEHPIRLMHNYWGVMLSLVISGFPVHLPADPVVRHRHRSVAGASRRDAGRAGTGGFRHPAAAAGAGTGHHLLALAFVQAFSVFPSAVLLGVPAGPTRVISIAAYQAAFEQYDYSLASAIAMLMAGVQVVIVVACSGRGAWRSAAPPVRGKG